jgi:Na+/phosphate symporter
MSEISHKEFDNIMRRIFLLLLNMIETVEHSIKTKSTDELKNIHMIDTNLDRFEDFCIRVLNKIGYREIEKTTLIHNTVFFLEMIGDEYKQLALDLMDSITLSKDLKNKLQETNKMFEGYYSLFYKFQSEAADSLIAKNENLKTMEMKIAPRISGREANVMAHCKAIRKYVSSLTELRIDMHYI